jgi:Protein of unknown function (DUF295)
MFFAVVCASIKKRRIKVQTMANPERDWNNLPSELIHFISQKLSDLCSFIRCRAVCKNWLSAILLSDPPQQKLPWLIEYQKEFPDATLLKEELRFYSFVTGETGSIRIQETHHGKEYHRPGHSYLLFVDGGAISLFNPLTNKEISLPSLHSHFDIIWPIFSGEDPSRNWLWHIVFHRFNQSIWNYAIYHPDSVGWRYVDNVYFRKTCYWLGMIYATDGCFTTVFDTTSGKKLYTIPPPMNIHCYLKNVYIVVACGVILRVCSDIEYCRVCDLEYCTVRDLEASFFYIHALKFEGERRQPYWVRVSDIGDQILFLDYNNGFSVTATAGLKGNCIYFIAENVITHPRNNSTRSKLWRYDIGAGRAERLHCPFERFTWFVPSLC